MAGPQWAWAQIARLLYGGILIRWVSEVDRKGRRGVRFRDWDRGEGRTEVEEEQLLRIFKAIMSSHNEQEAPDLGRGMREPLVLSFRLDQRPGESVYSRINTLVQCRK